VVENPTRGYFQAPETPIPDTFGEAKLEWDRMIAAILDGVGGAPALNVVLDSAGLAVVPSAHILLDTYEGAASDTCSRLSLTLPEGRIVVLRRANAARAITVESGASGAGGIDLATSSRLIPDTFTAIVVQRTGERWREVSLGAAGTGGGNVTGDNESITGNLPVFGDETGKAIVDSGVALSQPGLSSFLGLGALAPLNAVGPGHIVDGAVGKAALGIADNSRIVYIDASGNVIGLTLGTNLSLSGSTLNASGGAGSADWGNIGGLLANQLDLQAALDLRVPTSRSLQGTNGIAMIGDLTQDRTIQLADAPQATLKGRGAMAGSGPPTDLTPAEARAVLNVGDGADVKGPSGVTANRLAAFDGETGKLMKDGGYTAAEIIALGGGAATPPSFFLDGFGQLIEGATQPVGFLVLTSAVLADFTANATQPQKDEAADWVFFEDETGGGNGGNGGGGSLSIYRLAQGSNNAVGSSLAISGIALSGGLLPVGVTVETGDTIIAIPSTRRSSVSLISGLTGGGSVTLGSFALIDGITGANGGNQGGVSVGRATVTAVTSGVFSVTVATGSYWQVGCDLYLLKGAFTVAGVVTNTSVTSSLLLDIIEAAAEGDILLSGLTGMETTGDIIPPAGFTSAPSILLGSNTDYAGKSAYRSDAQAAPYTWGFTTGANSIGLGVSVLLRPAA
jgi:hypothetical protein